MPNTRQLFRQHSLRCTQQRMAVFEALWEYEGHPKAEELFRIVKPQTERLSLATVYNALDALVKVGLVRRMPMSNGCCRYDADTTLHMHVRFPETAEIEDVPPRLSEKLVDNFPKDVLEEIGQELGVRVDGMSIQLLATRAVEPS